MATNGEYTAAMRAARSSTGTGGNPNVGVPVHFTRFPKSFFRLHCAPCPSPPPTFSPPTPSPSQDLSAREPLPQPYDDISQAETKIRPSLQCLRVITSPLSHETVFFITSTLCCLHCHHLSSHLRLSPLSPTRSRRGTTRTRPFPLSPTRSRMRTTMSLCVFPLLH
jgi:hypothetical protein